MSKNHCKREEEKESVVVCVKGKKHDLIWLWWFEWWRWEWCWFFFSAGGGGVRENNRVQLVELV